MKLAKYDFPIKYFEDNLIFNKRGEVWAVYSVEGFSYDFLSMDEKFDKLMQISHMVASLGNSAKIFAFPIAHDKKRLFQKLREAPKENHFDKVSREYFDFIEEYVDEQTDKHGNINDYEFFLCLKLKNVVLDQKLKDMLLDIPRTVNSLMNVGTEYIVKSELQLYKDSSWQMMNRINGNIRFRETTTRQTQWILTRIMFRGLGLKASTRNNLNKKPWTASTEPGHLGKKEIIYPRTNELKTLFEGVISQEGRNITVDTQEGKSYQAFIEFSHIPDGIPFPGYEFLKRLYDFSIPSEICITIKPMEFKKALKKLETQQKKIKGQISHTVESNAEVKDELIEAAAQAKELERNLRSNHDPLLESTISICVSGENPEEVDKHVIRVKNYYRQFNFRVERSTQDQLPSFFQFIPGTPIYQSDYRFQLPPKTLAASMFLAQRNLGDNTGSYIGTVGVTRKPVFFSPFAAAGKREDGKGHRSPACFFMGTLGGGKSFNANLLTYSCIMQGARALIIDPKSERGHWKDELPEIAHDMTITSLSSDESDRGKLDPFNIYRDDLDDEGILDEASDLVRNILMEMYNIKTGSEEDVVLSETLEKVKQGVEVNGQKLPPSMELVYRMLYQVSPSDDLYNKAQLLARSIKANKDIGMAKLLFGTGTEKGLSFKSAVNILQIDGLNMPEPHLVKEEYNESQKLATILMIPIAAFAKRFANANRNEKKTILLDESWALRQTTEGKSLFNYLARTGRSLNCCTIFIGHSVKDVDDEGLKAAITFKFCFKVNTSDEAMASLEFMELDPSEENIAVLMNMENGHALFKDLVGNVDELAFDAVAEHIIWAFRTDPSKISDTPPEKVPSWK